MEELVCTNEQRTKQWEGYTGWLKRRGRDRYNVIIDGANVGYFKKNAADAGELADLKQVDWAVKKYEDEVRVDRSTLVGLVCQFWSGSGEDGRYLNWCVGGRCTYLV